MIKILVDTCTWLDLAKGADQSKLINIIEELIDLKAIGFIVPKIVLDEFDRNKERVIHDGTKSLSSVFGRVKDIVSEFGDPQDKEAALKQLNDVRHKLPSLVETTAFNISRIEAILKGATMIPSTDAVLIRAAQRAIDKRAPFHLSKNSMADAMLMEIYAQCITEPGTEEDQFAFVTHNKEDFGAVNKQHPHPDFAASFSAGKSSYFIKLIDALRHFTPELMGDIEAEQEWEEVPRTFTEILEIEKELYDRIWYNRHQNRVYKAKHGIDGVTKKDVELGKVAAKEKEEKYGKANLGPYDDFEWGMLNGKLSAIRWVTGSEWDFLDT
jgi:hypothetical protein